MNLGAFFAKRQYMPEKGRRNEMIETIFQVELPVGEHLAIRKNRIMPRKEICNPGKIALVSGIH